jgi:hypothetical protein
VRAAVVGLALLVGGCEPDAIDVLRPLDDGGSVASPSLCSIAGAGLCEGFEGQLLGYPPWGVIAMGAGAAIDGTRAYRGQHSLRVHLDAQPGGPTGDLRQGEVTEDVAVPLPNLYLRAFVYLPSPGPPATVRLATVFQHDPPYVGVALWAANGFLGYSGLDSDVTKHVSATAIPLDRWACVEWAIFADPSGTSQVWLDSVDVADLHVNGATQPQASLGWTAFGGGVFGVAAALPSYDFWIDEVLVDSRRLGCDR